MQKLSKSKVYRDPIYGDILVEYEIVNQLINTRPFQRLRRIKQLSGVNMVFHGAEHSRFSHSLGVYHMACKFLTNQALKASLSSERTQLLFLTTALLHDIGHGANSHAFEDVFKVNHEEIGAQIITKNGEIIQVLNQIDSEFKLDVASILRKTSKFPLLEQLLSSQLDVDRLDYLVRDSYFSGVPYGQVDADRIIRVLGINDSRVVYKKSGVPAIEDFIISRYHMFSLVYYHPVTRAYELILEKIYARVFALLKQGYHFKENISHLRKIADNPNDIETYLKIDDYYINGLILSFLESNDQILQSLADDHVNRRIWGYLDINPKNQKEIDTIIRKCGNEYYYATRTVFQTMYKNNPNELDNIMIIDESGKITKLTEESPIIASLVKIGVKEDPKFFYRKDE